MNSLESKVDRLTPEQRREVEDFVDFLLQRTGTPSAAPPDPAMVPPLIAVAPPSLPVQEPAAPPEPIKLHDLIRREDFSAALPHADPATLLIQEIASDGDDLLTGDYMDYGKFDKEPKTAVQKKQKKGKPPLPGEATGLLEWID